MRWWKCCDFDPRSGKECKVSRSFTSMFWDEILLVVGRLGIVYMHGRWMDAAIHLAVTTLQPRQPIHLVSPAPVQYVTMH